ncbi:C-C chemokine receptor type 7-like [Menidia menidia]
MLKLMLKLMPGLCEEVEGNSTSPDYDYSPASGSPDYDDWPSPCNKTSNRSFRSWFIPTFFALICVLGLAGNLLVVLTGFYFQRLKTMTDVYLLNLAFADLLFALSLPFWAAKETAEWSLGPMACKALHAVYKLSFYSSMLLLCLISVDRYFAIAKAVAAHRRRSEAVTLSKLSAAAAWGLALVFSVPEMVYTGADGGRCVLSASVGGANGVRVGVQAAQIAVAFVLPLVVMSACYASIVRTLLAARGFQRDRAVRVILAVVAVFLFSQMPYNAVLLWATVAAGRGPMEDCALDKTLMFATDATQALAFLRCCLNPFLYAFVGVRFRGDLLKLLKERGCLSQESFYRFSRGRRRSSGANNTDTSTTPAPKSAAF